MNRYAATIMRRHPRRASPFVRDGALDARVGKGWAARAAPAAVSQADFSAHHAARSLHRGTGLGTGGIRTCGGFGGGFYRDTLYRLARTPRAHATRRSYAVDGGLPVFPGQLFVISCLPEGIQAVIPLLRPFVSSPLKS